MTLNFDSYSTSFEGEMINPSSVEKLNKIWQGNYKLEVISSHSSESKSGLIWYNGQIEVVSESFTDWTIVRLSRKDEKNFSLKNFDFNDEGNHIYKIINNNGDEYQISKKINEMGPSETEDQDLATNLENNFSDVVYVDFYSIARIDTSTPILMYILVIVILQVVVGGL